MSAQPSVDFGRPVGQVAVDDSEFAHLMVPMGAGGELYGISLCGYPVEYLTLVPDLGWSEVVDGRRCEHCESASAS